MKQTEIVLTGDRPTGPLHLGHLLGSLQNRVRLQAEMQQYIMIADAQALTDNADNPAKVAANVRELVLDYLAVGIEPEKTTIFIQSQIPALFELTIYFLNLVTLNRVLRNPTVKHEIELRQFGESIPAGFAMYPISQAADIAGFKATLVPVGEDQLPMLEQMNEIVRTFNRYYGNVLTEARPLLSTTARLPGTDGKLKMSKSAGNAIFLADDADTISKKVMSMYTDPNHIRVSDPGRVEGNAVFTYLDIFDPNADEVALLKEQYRRGGLGDVLLKRRLNDILQAYLLPIRTRRQEYMQQSELLTAIVQKGSAAAHERTQEVLKQVKTAMGINYVGTMP
ncbi:tryptophan--tRNA ligase [Candidatus Dependentiae bacterium]|nr:tryptophan--tRNA ligase [Candidatus Dependentiae bacterium]